MLSWEYPPRIVGGISPHVFDLSRQLALQGIEVHVVTKETPLAPDEEVQSVAPPAPGGSPAQVFVHRVHLAEKPNDFIHEIQLLNDATEARVAELLEEWRSGGVPTLFHAHDWLSLDAARELKYEYSLPVIATIHATEEGRNGGIWNDMQRTIHEQEYWLTYEAWRVIVCSQYMKAEVRRQFDCPEDKVDIIFNGVDAKKFAFDLSERDRAAHRKTIADDDERIVMYVGRFVREKGIQILLDSASAVLAQQPRTKFVIVGGGPRERLEKFTHWYGLQDKVLFTGFMADRSLQMLYRCADVAVFPSLYEPFGIVALEAMAAGAPVVTSDAGGLREVVLHEKTGLTSYAGDPQSLAWAILQSLDRPDRAKAMAQVATDRLAADFDWSKIASQTIAVYERVWREFLGSHWADSTLWPVSEGARSRAAVRGRRPRAHPRPLLEIPEIPASFAHDESPRLGPESPTLE